MTFFKTFDEFLLSLSKDHPKCNVYRHHLKINVPPRKLLLYIVRLRMLAAVGLIDELALPHQSGVQSLPPMAAAAAKS